MGSIVLQCFSIFLLHLFLSSGSSVAEKPQLDATQKNRKLEGQEKRMQSSPLLFATQLDANVPIVNPTTPATPATTPPGSTTPGTTTPVVNPATSPPPPTITGPNYTPPTPTTTTPASSGGSWCVASPTASETALQVALDYACGYGGADCSAIQSGASCYNPNTVRDHASYAFNDYYHKNPAPTSCAFGGTAQLTNTDPSTGNCHYTSSSVTTSTTPANPPPSPIITTPTTTPATPAIMTPDASTGYGAAEPTGLPSSATSISCSLLLLLTAAGFGGSILVENYL